MERSRRSCKTELYITIDNLKYQIIDNLKYQISNTIKSLFIIQHFNLHLTRYNVIKDSVLFPTHQL